MLGRANIPPYSRHGCHVHSEQWGICVCQYFWSLSSWGQLHPIQVHAKWAMLLLIKCSSPFAAPRHPHLRAPPHVCCHAHAQPCLSTGWALNRHFDLTFGTAAVLAQGGGGTPLARTTPVSEQREVLFPQLLEPRNFAFPFPGRQWRSSFFIDLGLGMVFWGCWVLSCPFFAIVVPHSAPCFTFGQWARVACVFSPRVQTTPVAEQQWVLFPSNLGNLALFSQGGGGVTGQCMCFQAVKGMTIAHTALCPLKVSTMSLLWLPVGITITQSNGDTVPPGVYSNHPKSTKN